MGLRKAKEGEGVPGRKSILIKLGKVSLLDGGKGIEVKATFAMSATAVSKLYKMRRKFVRFLPAAIEGQIEDREYEFSGEVKPVSWPKPPNEMGSFVIHFPDTDYVNKALRHIRACHPPQVLLEQTQMDIEFPSEGEEESGQTEIE